MVEFGFTQVAGHSFSFGGLTTVEQSRARRRPTAPVAAPGRYFLAGWTIAWIGVGLFVAGAISFGTGAEFVPVLGQSVLFALVVGFSAYTAARLAFPITARLPFALRLGLDSLTVLSGTFFGSIVVMVVDPLYVLAEYRTVLLILAANGVLAMVVAVALATYDRMRDQIESSYRILRERDAFERQLEVAREVQRELLPKGPPDIAGLELAGVCRQAVAVGGDYYDYLRLADGRLGLVVADVSGKGVPASLLMASLQASARSLFPTTQNPATLNAKLNDALVKRSTTAHYATAVLASYDPETRQLRYSNAGHLPPLLIRGAEVIECGAGGLPIGLMPGATYDSGTQTLTSGDLLALFTDGVTETTSPDDEQFEATRLAELLKAHREHPLDAVIQTVFDELGRWSGPVDAHDDVTMVLARVK